MIIIIIIITTSIFTNESSGKKCSNTTDVYIEKKGANNITLRYPTFYIYDWRLIIF